MIDKVIAPYVERKRKELKLAPTQKALLIWDVFKGQKTAKVSLNITIVSVPAHMTHFFQPPDLTVIGEAKRFIKDKFTAWYSNEVKQQINSGGDSTDVNVDLRLTVLKPLHAVSLVDLYNHLTSPVCVGLIAKGWEKAGISDLLDGQTDLLPEDPFTDIELPLEIE